MRHISYYGLEKNPFIKEEIKEKEYESEELKEGISRLEYLKELKGIGLFIGMVGVGKTTVLRKFKNSLNKEKYNIVYISLNASNTFEFLNQICKQLKLDSGNCYINEMKEKIQEEIIRQKTYYRIETIIMIDNAEKLTRDMILNLDFLYEFDYNSVDYTTLILCGTEEIKSELTKNIYESIRQRIMCVYNMKGITREELKEYIKISLKNVNQENQIINDNAINVLYNATKGILREINTLLNLALIVGYQNQVQVIDEEIMRIVLENNRI